MKINTDVKANEWGTVVDDQGASVLVVRKDGKEIKPHQVEAFAHYCRYSSFPGMRKFLEKDSHDDVEDEEKERETFIMENTCQVKFEDFFKQFKRQKIAEGDGSWDAEISPYSV